MTKDTYKRKLAHFCGYGGLHCECCNNYHGKNKKKLNRLARARLKDQDINERRELL